MFTSGVEQTEYFDAETGLQIGWEASRQTELGIVPTSAILRDYKKFGALMQPTTIVQKALFLEQVLHVTTCEYDVVADQRVRSSGANQSPHQVMRRFDRRGDRCSAGVLAASPAPPLSSGRASAAGHGPRQLRRGVADDRRHVLRSVVRWAGLEPGVRAELRPRAQAAASPDDARRVINEMLARLNRSHFVVLSSSAVDDGGPSGRRRSRSTFA